MNDEIKNTDAASVEPTNENPMETVKATVEGFRTEVGEHAETAKANGAAIEDLSSKNAEQANVIADLKSRLESIELAGQRPGGRVADEKPKTVGELVVTSEDMDGIKSLGQSAIKGEVVTVEGGLFGAIKSPGVSMALADGDVVGGRLQQPWRDQDWAFLPNRIPTLLDFMTVLPAPSSAVEYVRETQYMRFAVEVSADTAQPAGSFPVRNVTGLAAGQYIVLTNGTVVLIASVTPDDDDCEPGGTVTLDGGTPTDVDLNVNDVLKVSASADGAEDELPPGVPDCALKPSGQFSFEVLTENRKTIATDTTICRQMLRDTAGLQDHIDSRLMDSITRAIEGQILYGDGSSSNLQGILTDADINTYSQASGPASDTKLDAIVRAGNILRCLEFGNLVAVVHPDDWTDIRLIKGDDEHYINREMTVGPGGAPVALNIPVVESCAIAPGTALVGDFGMGVRLYDVEAGRVRFSDQHADYFKRNLVLALAETDLIQTVKLPQAFVEVTFS